MGCSTLRPDLEQKRLAESTEADATVGGVGILWSFPKGSIYGIFTYIYHKNQPHVGVYTIHGSFGFGDLEKYCVALF